MNCYKKLYISTLFIAFSYGALRSLLYVLDEPTTFDESVLEDGAATFPSLTICFREYELDNFTTFIDVVQRIEQLQNVQNIQCSLEIWGKGIQRQFFDLKNESILVEKFNTTTNNVWLYFAMVQSEWLKPIVPCFTVTLPTLKHRLQESFRVRIYIYQKSALGYYFTKHESKQLRHDYEIEWNSDSFEILRPNEGKLEYLVEARTLSVKRLKYDCYEDNSMYFTDCIHEFYAEHLQCRLPWTTISGRKCETAEELQKYRILSDSITSQTMTNKIRAKGCFKPNCKKTTWTKNSFDEKWPRSNRTTNWTELMIDLPYSAKVYVKQEIKLADMSTFIADCGSYLGLFLGASLLSLTDLIVSHLLRIQRAYKDFFARKYQT